MLAGLALAVLARRLRPQAARAAALVLVGLSIALLVATTALAANSY